MRPLPLLALAGSVGCARGPDQTAADSPLDTTSVDSADTGDATDGLGVVEEGEWLPGDVATNTLMLGSNAFLRPAENLSEDHESMFYSGNSWFNQDFVPAPASTDTRDGLGPIQNARSCSGCHFKDGRAEPPAEPGADPLGTLVRLSIPGTGDHGGPLSEPTYGGQLQDGGMDGVLREGTVSITWETVEGTYDDGTPYTLRRPLLDLTDLQYGALHPDTRTSVRIAPQMIGLGLLEGIPEDRLAALEDPTDTNGDGISGRRNGVWNAEWSEDATGRFGWKAEQATVRTQTAGAFAGDMGITTSIVPADDCTEAQEACRGALSGGDPELEDHLLDRVALYSATVAVPVRRAWDTEEILRGKWLFADAGCDGCHVPSHETGAEAPIAEFEGLLIWPYTDLLLHDMGDGLDDGRPTGAASGSEWRTPPLWGLGLLPDVNGHNAMLHDGRARGHAEAILWHGGEGQAAMEAFRAMDAPDRAALIAFLESL